MNAPKYLYHDNTKQIYHRGRILFQIFNENLIPMNDQIFNQTTACLRVTELEAEGLYEIIMMVFVVYLTIIWQIVLKRMFTETVSNESCHTNQKHLWLQQSDLYQKLITIKISLICRRFCKHCSCDCWALSTAKKIV